MTDTITLPRATAQQALEALEAIGHEFICCATHHKKKDQHRGFDNCPNAERHQQAMTALRAALAEPEQQAEPVGEVTDTVDGAFKCEFSQHLPVGTKLYTAPRQQAEPVQEPFDGLATELFVVAQRSPADDGFSDTIDRIESWLREHFSTPPQRKELSAGEILNMMPSTIPAQYDGELMEFARAVETKIKEGT